MIKILLVIASMICYGCQTNHDISRSIFARNTSEGVSYILLTDNKHYIQLHDDGQQIRQNSGKYWIDGRDISFTDFIFFDKELKWIMNANESGFVSGYISDSCFYFHLDVPDARFCLIKNLPLKFDVIIDSINKKVE